MREHPFIAIDGVQVSYPMSNGGRKLVLNKVDLGLAAGEFVTLVGPSGCGKSTLLRLILGSETPTTGTVRVDGQPVSRIDRNRGIVFQQYSLFPHLSVLDNIALGPELEDATLVNRLFRTPSYRRTHARHREVAREFVTRLGLAPGDCDKKPYELSGGMRQRVAIAQALIMRPQILLMDEPFGALDVNTREEMQLLLLEQWVAHHLTIMFITHDLDEACFLGTRIIGLSQFWSDDPGKAAEGARVVLNEAIPGGHPKPTGFRFSDDFMALKQRVDLKVLDPEHLQHISEFDASYQDSGS